MHFLRATFTSRRREHHPFFFRGGGAFFRQKHFLHFLQKPNEIKEILVHGRTRAGGGGESLDPPLKATYQCV